MAVDEGNQVKSMRGSGLHYDWLILAAGILVVAGALGLARFGFGMILPSSRTAWASATTRQVISLQPTCLAILSVL